MTRARSLVTGAVVLLSSVLVWGCGSSLTACKAGSTCNAVAGSYGVDTTQTQGSCDFTPYTLPSTLTVQQNADLTQVSVGILDQVNQQSLELTGPLYAPSSSAKTDLGTISLTRRTSRLATAGSSTQVDLQIILSASVTNDKDKSGNYILSGSLATMNIPSGTAGAKSCTVTVSFSASMPAP